MQDVSHQHQRHMNISIHSSTSTQPRPASSPHSPLALAACAAGVAHQQPLRIAWRAADVLGIRCSSILAACSRTRRYLPAGSTVQRIASIRKRTTTELNSHIQVQTADRETLAASFIKHKSADHKVQSSQCCAQVIQYIGCGYNRDDKSPQSRAKT
jgi:hypothetical protein